uniref:ATP synthase F0 subunit 8 n=1 Tax=Riquetophycus sp. HSY-2014a TaxID=1488470 RepID=A0A0E3DBC6_9FLOR|nr:ATP synthase F0 subunit 8 [Riquetophycus sp. HSY-2014a]
MPQLDRIIIFSQIFWLFIIFTSLYAILTHFFLPKFLKSLKARKQIIEVNDKEIIILNNKFNEQQILVEQTIIKNLNLIEDFIKNELEFSKTNKLKSSIQLIDERIADISLNSLLYCDTQLLNSISLFPKSLNLKYKFN